MNRMLKTLLIFLTLITINVTVCGQNLVPLRIVYQGDTGIFFQKNQETELLTKLKYKEIYKENLDSLYKFSFNCSENVKQLRFDYDSLNVLYDTLEVEAKAQRDSVRVEKGLRVAAEGKATDQENKKKTWRGIAIGESVLLIITLAILL